MDKFDHAVTEMAAIVAEADKAAQIQRMDALLGYMADNFDFATVNPEDMALRKLFSGPVEGDFTAEMLREMPEAMTPLIVARLLLTRHRVPLPSRVLINQPGWARFRSRLWRLVVEVRPLRYV